MLSQKMVDLLNAQIGRELESSIIYLQMSAWCASNGLDGCAEFLRGHSREEMGHMMKMFGYVEQTGAQPIIPAMPAPPHEFKSILDLFKATLEHEKYITRSILDLVEAAHEEKDYGTFSFLQWYVTEQQEEEALFGRVVATAEMIGLENRGLFMLDRAVAGMRGPE